MHCPGLADAQVDIERGVVVCTTLADHYVQSMAGMPNIFGPASLRDYKEGGSYDFFIQHGEKKILIRPSFNYIEGQLDGIQADVLFLGVAGLAKADEDMEKAFYAETVEKTKARLVIPVHWDNFFASLEKPVEDMPELIEKTDVVFYKLARYCEAHDVNCLIQYPCTSIEI